MKSKSFYKRISSWLKYNKQTIFVVLGILFLLMSMSIIYNNFFVWFWSDFFLFIILFVFGLLFFPFSFSFQKKLFGASLYTIDWFSILMFFVFIGFSFDILSEIFQGDFIVTFSSAFIILIVLFWWGLIIPRSKLFLSKYLGKSFVVNGTKLFFGLLVVVSIVDLSGLVNRPVSVNKDSVVGYSRCFGDGLKSYNDNNITINIIDSNVFTHNNIDKNIFSNDELSSLYYYIEGKSLDKEYYINREVCNIDKNKPLIKIMSDGGLQIDKVTSGADFGIGSNISSFEYYNFDNGDYVLNVFVSDDNKSWDLAKTLKFAVK